MYIGLMIAAFMFGLGIAIPAAHATLQPNSYPPTGAVLSCQGRPWIDVMCYGADPTGVADSFTAINTAITDAIVAGGVPVHFPNGKFKIGSKLTLDYSAVAATGLQIISDSATLDGTSIGGTALQIQCSGGTPGSPAICNNLEIQGPLTVKGNAPSGYVVVVGTTNFADQHSGVRFDHLIATNASVAIGAGGIQLNYIVGRELWVSGNTLGGGTAAAVALEQVQNSKISGDGTAAGPTASSLMIENGATTGNLITAFDYNSSTAISLSITSPTAKANTFLSPVFNGTTAINANQFASGNAIIGPTYNGTNKGPSSTGINILGRGSLSRYSAPTASTLLLTGADDGTIFSPTNGTGAGAPFAAVTLNFTLPTPSQVGAGWTAAFLSDNSKASVINAPGGSSILTSSGQQLSTMTVGAPNAVNYEVAVIESDGTNFRLMYATDATKQAIGAVTAHYPAKWEFPSTSGYAATQNDNGIVLDDSLVGGPFTVTLPSTTSITPGWTMSVVADGNNATINTNGVSGGNIVTPTGLLANTLALVQKYEQVVFHFDGASFRAIVTARSSVVAFNVVDYGAVANTNSSTAIQAAINAASAAGGGVVFVPPGGDAYIINQGLTLPAGVVLQGAGGLNWTSPIDNARTDWTSKSSWLWCQDASNPCITLNGNGSQVRGLNFWYTQTTPVPPTPCGNPCTYVAYTEAGITPYTILVSTTAAVGNWINDVNIANATNCVDWEGPSSGVTGVYSGMEHDSFGCMNTGTKFRLVDNTLMLNNLRYELWWYQGTPQWWWIMQGNIAHVDWDIGYLANPQISNVEFSFGGTNMLFTNETVVSGFGPSTLAATNMQVSNISFNETCTAMSVNSPTTVVSGVFSNVIAYSDSTSSPVAGQCARAQPYFFNLASDAANVTITNLQGGFVQSLAFIGGGNAGAAHGQLHFGGMMGVQNFSAYANGANLLTTDSTGSTFDVETTPYAFPSVSFTAGALCFGNGCGAVAFTTFGAIEITGNGAFAGANRQFCYTDGKTPPGIGEFKGLQAWCTRDDASGNFELDRYSPSGTYADSPIVINKNTGTINFSDALSFTQTTVAALGPCGGTQTGWLKFVSDASSPSYGAALVGGGSTRTLALCNGNIWTAH